jgi:hypothetical protein
MKDESVKASAAFQSHRQDVDQPTSTGPATYSPFDVMT